MPYLPQKKKKRYNKRVSTAKKEHLKLYHSVKWRRLRKAKLRMNPLCEHCEQRGLITPAKEVDHFYRVADYPELFYDLNNLQSLCTSCHSIKSQSERNKNAFK